MLEAIEQFDENKANERVLGGGRSSFKFVLGHIIWDRCQMTKILGEPQSFPWVEKFASGQSHADSSDYPELSELANAYKELAVFLERKLESLSEEALMKSTENAFPEQEKTIRGGISFWVWQDCYHMGQTGSILTTLGLPDIKTLYHTKKERVRASA
jgi:uncharacterized damage-inducible protein DinB